MFFFFFLLICIIYSRTEANYTLDEVGSLRLASVIGHEETDPDTAELMRLFFAVIDST